jgi:hypothetical protein
VLERGIGFKSLALYLVEEIGTTAEELVMGKLPCLVIRRRALGTRRAVNLVEAIHIQLAHEAGELRTT